MTSVPKQIAPMDQGRSPVWFRPATAAFTEPTRVARPLTERSFASLPRASSKPFTLFALCRDAPTGTPLTDLLLSPRVGTSTALPREAEKAPRVPGARSTKLRQPG